MLQDVSLGVWLAPVDTQRNHDIRFDPKGVSCRFRVGVDVGAVQLLVVLFCFRLLVHGLMPLAGLHIHHHGNFRPTLGAWMLGRVAGDWSSYD